MALTIGVGDPSIERTRGLVRVSLPVTISESETVLRRATVAVGINPANENARQLLVQGLRAKALAVKADVADEQALDARLDALRSDVEAALAG